MKIEKKKIKKKKDIQIFYISFFVLLLWSIWKTENDLTRSGWEGVEEVDQPFDPEDLFLGWQGQMSHKSLRNPSGPWHITVLLSA